MVANVPCYPLTAARANGVDDRKWYAWLERGRASTTEGCIYAELVQRLTTAQAQAEILLTAIVAGSARDRERVNGPEHAKWLLERFSRKNWGTQIRMHVESELERHLDAAQRVLSVEDYAALLAAWAQLADGDGGE